MSDRAPQADVSLQALVTLEESCASYAAGTIVAMNAVRGQFEARVARLRDLEVEAVDQLAGAEAVYDSADDDDRASCLAEFQDASDRVNEIRRWLGDVDSEFAILAARSRSADDALADRLRRARAYLREKIGQLQDYQAVTLDVGESLLTAHSQLVSSAVPTAMPLGGPLLTARLREIPLPRGYRWVSLSEFDVAKELQGVTGPESFTKVPYDTVVEGFSTLRDEILPSIVADPGRRTDYFREVDRQKGLDYAHGLQRIFEAFFGLQDFIYFARRPDGSLDLINGRHRVKVALDLGWDAVPAQVKE